MYKFSNIDLARFMSEEFEPILEIIKNKKPSKELEQVLKKYLIIRTVTLIEEFYKNTVSYYIDDFNFQPKGLFQEEQLTISLSNLELLTKEKITKGKIIASSFNFQNPDDIHLVMSKMINDNFFEKMEKVFDANAKWASKNNNKSAIITMKNFLEIFDLRNSIVHTMKITVKKNTQEMKSLQFGILLFLGYSKVLLASKISNPKNKSGTILGSISGTVKEMMENPAKLNEEAVKQLIAEFDKIQKSKK